MDDVLSANIRIKWGMDDSPTASEVCSTPSFLLLLHCVCSAHMFLLRCLQYTAEMDILLARRVLEIGAICALSLAAKSILFRPLISWAQSVICIIIVGYGEDIQYPPPVLVGMAELDWPVS